MPLPLPTPRGGERDGDGDRDGDRDRDRERRDGAVDLARDFRVAARWRLVATWGDNAVSSGGSYGRATGPGTSAGAFPMELFLSGEGARGPRRGTKGSCGTPGTPLS